MSLFEDFCKKFKPFLSVKEYKRGQFNRWSSFEFIAKELFDKKNDLKIIETGCLREENNWLGHGHSTLIWDYILSRKKGKCFSVDIDYDAIKLARSKCTKIDFIHCDSVGFLRNADAQNIDLLFLDSYDWSPEKHINSCLHHVTELGSIWERLPSGCLVAVDDCHSQTQGKHVLVQSFFEQMYNLEPLAIGHLQVWRKP